MPHNAESRQAVRKLVGGFYRSLLAETLSDGPGAKGKSVYHHIDPGLLFYVNTVGCRCRAVMAAFVDAAAYSGAQEADCCDNFLYSGSDDVPKWQRHRVDARHSLRFLSTR